MLAAGSLACLLPRKIKRNCLFLEVEWDSGDAWAAILQGHAAQNRHSDVGKIEIPACVARPPHFSFYFTNVAPGNESQKEDLMLTQLLLTRLSCSRISFVS